MNDSKPSVFSQKNSPVILGRLEMLRLISFGKIIDVGCGLGTTFGKDAVNLDKIPNEEMIKIVEKEDKILYDWFKILFPDGKTANYVQADATIKIPFDDKTFDCALLSEVVEHLVEADTVAMLKEAGRVADFVILSCPNEWEWPESIAFNKNVQVEEHKHVTFHTKETLMDAAQKAGLKVIYYLKVNCDIFSHHIMVASNSQLYPVVHRFGMGYGIGYSVSGMPVTVDETVSYIPISKLEEKK